MDKYHPSIDYFFNLVKKAFGINTYIDLFLGSPAFFMINFIISSCT